jgi:CDP-6-deoxy-D-xylo-4-hexulose-3-dehydrase
VLSPDRGIDRRRVLPALKAADIDFRVITGGNILRHDVVRYFDYDCVGEIRNADIVHDRGFFVGNHPYDLTPQITRLREVLDAAAR